MVDWTVAYDAGRMQDLTDGMPEIPEWIETVIERA